MRPPPPPSDTPAGDMALAASQLDQESGTLGASQAFEAPPAGAAASQADPEQQQEEAADGGEEQQQKKRPRIVAT